ncbi:MAG: hypothetical protein K8S18_12185 [Desulfobacula sp.]|nr:hypothetical protein [Desulfobacula sp.]
METHILLINYIENTIPDLKKSKFHDRMEFKTISSDKILDFPLSKESCDILVVFMDREEQEWFRKIADIKKTIVDMQIIVAVPKEFPETGVKALQNGASDYFALPATKHIFDFYINRSLEHNYLHNHLCYYDNCYKSRFASSSLMN